MDLIHYCFSPNLGSSTDKKADVNYVNCLEHEDFHRLGQLSKCGHLHDDCTCIAA